MTHNIALNTNYWKCYKTK